VSSLADLIRRSNLVLQLDEYIVYCVALVCIGNVVSFDGLDDLNSDFCKGFPIPVAFLLAVVVTRLQLL
jgi:hypothetical protein